MFGRFTAQARQVVTFAQEEALALRHNYIGTEHLLLGLLRVNDSPAARALASLDVTAGEVRPMVARIVGPGDEAPTGQIPFTPRSKKVLELALREALRLQSAHVGPAHILLGLVGENEGVAAQILLDFEADATKVRQETLRAMGLSEEAALEAGAGALRPSRSPGVGFAELPAAASPSSPALVLAVVLAALGFPAGLLIGFLVWG